MKSLKLGAIALASLIGMVGTSAPAAGPNGQPVERFGRVFAVSVCGRLQVALQARCFGKVVTDARGTIINGKPDLNRFVTPSGYGPSDLNGAYGLSPAKGAPGSGPTIAIVDAYGYPNAEADLARLSHAIRAAGVHDGQRLLPEGQPERRHERYPRTNTGWGQENALDLDMASAMCPNCKILLVEATSAVLRQPGGRGEPRRAAGRDRRSPTAMAAARSRLDQLRERVQPPGRGDHRQLAATAATASQFPASSPHVIAVGGTHLVARRTPRLDARRCGPAPAAAAAAYVRASRRCADRHRLPDRTDRGRLRGRRPEHRRRRLRPTYGDASGWMVFGGTSVAAPLIGGIYAAAGAVRQLSDDQLYAGTRQRYCDITSGSNGSLPRLPLCNAGSGLGRADRPRHAAGRQRFLIRKRP